MVYLFKKKLGTRNKIPGPGPAPHPSSVPVTYLSLPFHSQIIPQTPLSPDSQGGHGKREVETPKNPYNARFVKRGIFEKPRKMPGSHREDYVGGKTKRSSF